MTPDQHMASAQARIARAIVSRDQRRVGGPDRMAAIRTISEAIRDLQEARAGLLREDASEKRRAA